MPSFPKQRITRRGFLKGATAASAGVSLGAGIKQVWAAPEDNVNWFEDIYRQLHTDGGIGGQKDLHKSFDAEAAAQMFEESGVQMVSYFAKGGNGYAYYPTKIGMVEPSLDRDCVGELTRALKKRGIRCVVYFYLGRDRRYNKEHPDWVYRNEDTGLSFSSSSDVDTMCFKSPYVDQIGIPQMKEVISLYDVDGFFVDIVLHQFLVWVCRCKYCRESFAEEVGGEIPKDDSDPKAFAYRKWANRHFESHMEKVHRALAEVKPEIAVINNYSWLSRYPVTPHSYVKHVTWDTPIPREGLYSWNFSFEARYLSTLTDVLPDITWSCMSTAGNTWGDYALREKEAHLHECAILLAGCGRTYPSYNPHPSGNPVPAVMDLYREVNKRTSDLEPFVKGCNPVKDVAILHSADSLWSKTPMIPAPDWTLGPAYHPVAGAHKAMIEGHVQICMPNSEVFVDTIRDYAALILPDQRILNEKECEAIRSFVKNGGALFATCETGTRDTDNNRLNDFSIADVLGIKYLESADTSNCFLQVKTKNKAFDIPAMDIQVNGNYVRIKTTTAKTLLELVPTFKGKRAPAEFPEGPGVTINSYGKGKAIYCAPALFDAYYSVNTPVLRKLSLWMLDQVYPNNTRTIVLEKTPINVEVFYNHRSNERFIHLINYSGDKREVGSPQVQDMTTVYGIRVKARLKKRPAGITSVPDGQRVEFTYRNGWVSFDSEPLEIHNMYRIES